MLDGCKTVLKYHFMMIISYFRTQHATETTKYKTQIDIAENEIVRLEFVLQKEQEARKHAEESAVNNGGGNYAVGGAGGHQAGMDRLDISQIEREAAEGQEVDQSLLASSLASPLLMPLDQLLAQPGNSGKSIYSQGVKGHWAVYYTSLQSFIITSLIRWFNNIGDI